MYIPAQQRFVARLFVLALLRVPPPRAVPCYCVKATPRAVIVSLIIE